MLTIFGFIILGFRVGIQKGNLMMLSGSFYIAKDRDSRPQGDDSHFICEEKQTIGLADGVGGWSSQGVDAGLYARELMNNSLLAILTQPDRQVDPMKVLNEAFRKTDAEGSSTACIITLQEGTVCSFYLISFFCINHANWLLTQI